MAAIDQLIAESFVSEYPSDTVSNRLSSSTGFRALDSLMQGRGWPVARLSELYCSGDGHTAITLLTPLLVQATQGDRWCVMIAPPRLPHAASLSRAGVKLNRLLLVHPRNGDKALNATIQALQSRHCGTVISWLPEQHDKDLARLRLLASQRHSASLLCLPQSQAAGYPHGALQLQLQECDGQWELQRLDTPTTHTTRAQLKHSKALAS